VGYSQRRLKIRFIIITLLDKESDVEFLPDEKISTIMKKLNDKMEKAWEKD
jgi:hypothetical protein